MNPGDAAGLAASAGFAPPKLNPAAGGLLAGVVEVCPNENPVDLVVSGADGAGVAGVPKPNPPLLASGVLVDSAAELPKEKDAFGASAGFGADPKEKDALGSAGLGVSAEGVPNEKGADGLAATGDGAAAVEPKENLGASTGLAGSVALDEPNYCPSQLAILE